jgi:hypothetical protein
MSDKNRPENVKLENVRLSFPSLFKAKTYQGDDADKDKKPKFSATFLMDAKKNAKDIAAIKTAMNYVLTEKYGNKIPKGFKLCLRNGAEKEDTEGYGEGIFFIKAKTEKRPPVVDRDLTPLTEEDGKPYAGCYVNASIRFWVQDNTFGKRVNASLRTVQFVKDGESFGEKPIDPEEEFSALPESDSADDDNSVI